MLEPLVSVIAPPVPVANMESPAVRCTAPPTCVSPWPTVIDTAPPRPLVASSVAMLIAPLEPSVAPPVLKLTEPLTPVLPEFSVESVIDPLDARVLAPVCRASAPPVPRFEAPPVSWISPPKSDPSSFVPSSCIEAIYSEAFKHHLKQPQNGCS